MGLHNADNMKNEACINNIIIDLDKMKMIYNMPPIVLS